LSWLRLKTEGAKTAFQPGETLAGTADWKLDAPAQPDDVVELRLLWFTSGRGTPDAGLVETAPFEAPAEEDRRDFRFRLPEGPYSFVGKLITLEWALEAVIAGNVLGRLEITVSPTGEPVRLK
jgi:hypothetical protein